jgi:hypothetical protein
MGWRMGFWRACSWLQPAAFQKRYSRPGGEAAVEPKCDKQWLFHYIEAPQMTL